MVHLDIVNYPHPLGGWLSECFLVKDADLSSTRLFVLGMYLLCKVVTSSYREKLIDVRGKKKRDTKTCPFSEDYVLES